MNEEIIFLRPNCGLWGDVWNEYASICITPPDDAAVKCPTGSVVSPDGKGCLSWPLQIPPVREGHCPSNNYQYNTNTNNCWAKNVPFNVLPIPTNPYPYPYPFLPPKKLPKKQRAFGKVMDGLRKAIGIAK